MNSKRQGETRKKDSKHKIIYIFFCVFFLSLCLQNIIIYDFGDFALKPCHLISLFGLLYIIKYNKIKLPPKILSIFVIFSIAVSLICSPIFGLDGLMINYIYGFIIILIVMNMGEGLSKQEWLSIGRWVAIIIAIITAIRFALNIETIVHYLKNSGINGHIGEKVGTVFGGGSNLEATWIALLGFFFYNHSKSTHYLLFSFIVSIVMSSRAGLIADFSLLTFLLMQNNQMSKSIKVKRSLFLVFAIIVLFIIGNETGLTSKMFMRFSSSEIGSTSDAGSQGRIRMWQFFLPAFAKNPFGYGLGNSVAAISDIGGLSYSEGNIHNIYLQVLLDTGIVGFAISMTMVISFLIKNIKEYTKNPFSAFIITYLVLGLLQFRGADVVVCVVIGIYLAVRKARNEK